jgi:hypothetical protein
MANNEATLYTPDQRLEKRYKFLQINDEKTFAESLYQIEKNRLPIEKKITHTVPTELETSQMKNLNIQLQNLNKEREIIDSIGTQKGFNVDKIAQEVGRRVEVELSNERAQQHKATQVAPRARRNAIVGKLKEALTSVHSKPPTTKPKEKEQKVVIGGHRDQKPSHSR